jgi:hypothetical protein
MTDRFEDLWSSAADDGASCLARAYATESSDDIDQLLDAWYRERSVRIEYALVLEQAHRLITRLLADHELTTRRRREARRVLLAIRKVRDLTQERD